MTAYIIFYTDDRTGFYADNKPLGTIVQATLRHTEEGALELVKPKHTIVSIIAVEEDGSTTMFESVVVSGKIQLKEVTK